MMKTVAIVQARMGSTRLPNKVMKPICGVPMIEILLARLSRAKQVDEVVLATSMAERNQPLVEHVHKLGFSCVRGSEDDVLARYLQAAREHEADVLLRITGDCPLVDPALVDQAIRKLHACRVDYLSNVDPPTYPDGLDIEVFTRQALERAAKETSNPFDREHVTPYLRGSGEFSKANLKNNEDLSGLRWTVDELADFDVISRVFAFFAPDIHFSWQQVRDLRNRRPELFMTNQQIARNEGNDLGTGRKLWKRSKQIIPGGNMLLSKRPEMFLPGQWPAYFSTAKGCRVWDLDGREFTDMSVMGVGTNTLGYGHPEVDDAVMKTVQAGNLSTLNCPEEVYLAEKLIELHSWADMVRFARTGGESNAIAIRIARAASGRDKVAICGYHGWHDWYLSANLSDDANLDGHLLPGLEPKGVPRHLQGTVLPFNYNDIEGLIALVSQHDIGVIKMEVSRNYGPENNFLQKVRDLATSRGIVLVFDECTSGFRETFGGLHKKYGVNPDMAVFGKTLGNGYAITAVIGRRDIMESAQSTFISSTFWSERIGPSAALKTLEVMEREKSWEKITKIGLEIRSGWQKLADKHGVSLSHWGLPALTGFTINNHQNQVCKTFITQEMLKRGFLAGNAVYCSTAHTPEVLDEYFKNLDPIFGVIAASPSVQHLQDRLEGPLCHTGFSRLN